MAYEIWTWMNQNGYYQPPTFNNTQTTQMMGMFQPMDSSNNMGTINLTGQYSGIQNQMQ
jgi:spore coat protein CotF